MKSAAASVTPNNDSSDSARLNTPVSLVMVSGIAINGF